MSHKNHREDSAIRQRDWRRIHHSPLFWIGALLFVAAVALYLL